MKIIFREQPANLSLELLYADNSILMAETEEGLREKNVQWKSGFEVKGLKMNTRKRSNIRF